LTPGEVMQLPSSEELVLVAGCPPIRAKKLRYYGDRNFTSRLLKPPLDGEALPEARLDDWGRQIRTLHEGLMVPPVSDDSDEGGPGFGSAGTPVQSPGPKGPRSPGPARPSRPRQPLQQGLFDAIPIADGLEQTTGIDLTGRGNK
jgi:type IV secretion system protein VirD4